MHSSCIARSMAVASRRRACVSRATSSMDLAASPFDALEEAPPPLTGDVTVALELAGTSEIFVGRELGLRLSERPPRHSRRCCAPRAMVEAFVGLAVAFAFASAVLALATWASATCAVDSAALSAPALVPVRESDGVTPRETKCGAHWASAKKATARSPSPYPSDTSCR